MTTALPTASELAETIKAEVTAMIAAGKIPATVASFSELHDYVDANCLGGTEALWRNLPTTAHGDVDGPARNDLCEVMNAAHDEVDAWLKRGGLLEAVK